jgi:linoleoyl-CoA desaturase
MALSLDLLGASSYIWAHKHNLVHHSYANVTGHDDDIDLGILGRLSPHQPWRRFHRLQHFYLWLLYGLLPIKWQAYDDFRDCVTGRIGGGGHQFQRPRGWNLVNLFLGKVVFFSLAIALPALLHPLWAVLAVYVLASFVQGITLSVVFQLAHCVETANFPMPRSGTMYMDRAWAEHQVETTVDFARGSRLLCWFVGGLNFQVVHHLFPRVCHIHYPALAEVVEQTCADFGLRYMAYDSLGQALASHYRWLRLMGQSSGQN